MPVPAIEPLDPETWFSQAGKLLDSVAKLDGEAPDRYIRRAYHLIALVPGPLRHLFPENLDSDALDKMLDCGGYESAVMALIGHHAAFTARKQRGMEKMTVSLELDPRAPPGLGEHQSCAKAMLQAWAQSIVNIGTAADVFKAPHPDQRKSPAEPHPSSTEH